MTKIPDKDLRVEQLSWEIESEFRSAMRAHRAAADFQTTLNTLTGLPAAILSAIAGVSALADYKVAAAVIAFLVAALSATVSFLHPAERSQDHSTASHKLHALLDQMMDTWREAQASGPSEFPRAIKELKRIRDEGREALWTPWIAPRHRKRGEAEAAAERRSWEQYSAGTAPPDGSAP